MRSTESDFYTILEVDSAASKAQIKKAFHRLAFLHHPDRNANDPEANERFRKINEAYQVLADVSKRNRYDQQRENYFHIPSQGFEPFIYSEINKATVRRNEEVELTFAFGAEGRFFKKKEIPGCYITSGPIVSHRMKVHQGIEVRETLLTYTICPLVIGEIFISPATINYYRNNFSSNSLQLLVVENNCFFKTSERAGNNPAKVLLNYQRITSNTIYRKTIIHQRTVLIPRSDLVAWYHKVGRTMKISFAVCGFAWALVHHQSLTLGFVSGSLFAGINCTLMYRIMGIKSMFYYSTINPVVQKYLSDGYSLGTSPSNSKNGNKIWYLFKNLFS